MKILLVADEDDRIRNIVRLIFTENNGYKVVSSSNGREAVVKAEEIRPDIIFVDVSLSDKDGYQVLREIRNDPYLKQTCVILINSEFAVFDKEKALNACAVDVITKPFGTEVVQKIESLINQHENRETRFTSILHPLEVSKNMNSAKIAILSQKHRKLNKSIDQRPFEIIIRSLKAESLKGRSLILFGGVGVLLAALIIMFSNVRKENGFLLNNIPKPNSFFTQSHPKTSLEVKYSAMHAIESEPFTADKDGQEDSLYDAGDVEFEKPGFISENGLYFEEPQVGSGNLNEKDEIAASQQERSKASEKLKKVKTEDKPSKRIEESNQDLNGNKYVVKRGENLFAIAKRFNTSVKELKVVNKLRGDRIRVGQVLVVANVVEKIQKEEVAIIKKNDKPGIKITGLSFFNSLSGLVIHSFNIENRDDIAYKDIKVRVRYYSNGRTELSSKTFVLPVILRPKRSKIYTKECTFTQAASNGAYGSDGVYSAKIEFLEATPITHLADSTK